MFIEFDKAVCRGCRAVALASADSVGREDYLGPDPQCAYYREAKEPDLL